MKSNHFLAQLVLVVLLLGHFETRAAEYYVAPHTNPHGNGSIDSPWSSISDALDILQPGDTLFLRGGTYFESEISVSLKGKKHSKIVIRSFPGERAKIVSMNPDGLKGFAGPWTLMNPEEGIYKTDIGMERPCMAWLTNVDQLLWRYSTYQDLSAPSSSGRYCGPGIFQNGTELFLRVESESSSGDSDQRGAAKSFSGIDHYRDSLLFTSGETLFSLEACAHVEITVIDFHSGAFSCIDVTDRSHDIVINGCSFRFYVYGLRCRINAKIC